MASAWGNSWGNYWGNSWGTISGLSSGIVIMTPIPADRGLTPYAVARAMQPIAAKHLRVVSVTEKSYTAVVDVRSTTPSVIDRVQQPIAVKPLFVISKKVEMLPLLHDRSMSAIISHRSMQPITIKRAMIWRGR